VSGTFSPDGSHIAFWKDEKYWLAGPNGEEPRPLMELERRYQFRGPKWSPDGSRIVYLKNTFGTRDGSIEARSASDGSTTTLLAAMGLLDFWWTSDNRLIYSAAATSEDATYDLWERHIDPKTLSMVGEPRRLTRWVGHSPGFVSISTDGKRIVTTKGYSQSDVYVAELESNRAKLKPEQRLTLDTRSDLPSSWTRDGKEILFFSDRNGAFNIFKQSPNSQDAELIVRGKEDARSPQLSADGRWLLYTVWPDRAQKQPVRVMRTAPAGGPSELVLEAAGAFKSGISFSPTGEQDPQGKGLRSFPEFRCPSNPAAPCVVAEAEQDSVVFTYFDPVRGRGAEAARLRIPPSTLFWDISPDGSRLAYGESRSSPMDHVSVLSLKDQASRDIPLNAETNLSSISWSADGRDLFIATFKREGSDLLHVSSDGKVDVLSQVTGRWFGPPRPSPDDRFLAFGLRTVDSNVWLIETK
jgi:Tol biopolymer transport system component